MNEAFDLSFRYSATEVARAMRCHYAFRLHPRRDTVIAVVLFLVGTYLWRFTDAARFGLFFIGASGVFVLILIGAFIVVPRLAFRFEPKFRDEYSLTFTPQGIHFRTAHIDSQLAWGLYSRTLVDRDFYLLYYGSRAFTIIPKRVFTGPDQLKNFEELLKREIGNIVHKS